LERKKSGKKEFRRRNAATRNGPRKKIGQQRE